MQAAYHGAVKVRLVAFVRVREKRELGNAEDVSVYILHTSLPHRACRGVVEHTDLKTVVIIACVSKAGLVFGGRVGVHFVRQDLDVCHGVICAVDMC
jgi:lipid-binding SYLF domain-containing protein